MTLAVLSQLSYSRRPCLPLRMHTASSSHASAQERLLSLLIEFAASTAAAGMEPSTSIRCNAGMLCSQVGVALSEPV